MIEGDINERMARLAPSQNVGEPDPVALDIAREMRQPTPAAMPEVDPIALEVAQQERMGLMASLYGASEIDPDEAAKAQQIGNRVGIGGDVVRRNMPYMRRRVFLEEAQQRDLTNTDPVLARWLQERKNAEIAHDDIDALASFKPIMDDIGLFWFTGATPGMRKGYKRGEMAVERGNIGAKAMAGIAMPEDMERAAKIAQEMRELQDVGFLGSATEVIAQMVGQAKELGTATVAGAAIGSAFPGPGTFTGAGLGFAAGTVASTAKMEAGNAYLDMREEGLSDDVAMPAAIATGYLNGLIEVVGTKIASIPFRKLAQKIAARTTSQAIAKPTVRAALAQAGKSYFTQIAAEGTEEALQETTAIAFAELAKAADGINSEMSAQDAIDRIIESFIQGSKAAVILGGVGPGANLVVDVQRVDAAEKQQQFFENLADRSVNNKVRLRYKDAFEQFIDMQANGADVGTLYLDANTATQLLAQSGLTPQQVDEALPGMRQQLQELGDARGDVTIPTARFASTLAGTPLGSQLMPHLRVDPSLPSITEAARIRQNMPAILQEMERIEQSVIEQQRITVAQEQSVEQEQLAALEAAGRPRETARMEAKVYSSFIGNLSEMLQMPVERVQQMFRVTVEGEAQAAQGVRGIQGIMGEMAPAEGLSQAGRTQVQQRARQLGLPATTATATMQRQIDVLTQDPRTWTREDFDQVKDYLSIHQDLRPGSAERAESIMREGLRGGMVDSIGAMEAGRWTWAGGLQGGEAYIFPTNTLRFLAADDPNLAPGNRPLLKITPKAGQSIYDAIRETAVWNPESIPAAPGVMEQAATMDAEYLAAVERGDMATAQRMVDEKRTAQGYVHQRFHQTSEAAKQAILREGFRLDRGQARLSDELVPDAYFFKADPSDIGVGGTEQIPVVLRFTNAKTFANRQQLAEWARSNPKYVAVANKLQEVNRTWKQQVDELWSEYGKMDRTPSNDPIRRQFRKRIGQVVDQWQADVRSVASDARAIITRMLRADNFDAVILESDEGSFGREVQSTMVFDPEQIKLADPVTRDEAGNVIPLSRRFDITSPRIFEQAPVTPGFYSALEREVGAIDAKALTASGWNERFKGLISKGAIKADELEWSGLADYLKMQEGKVSKDAVLEFLRGNGVRVEQLTLDAGSQQGAILSAMESGIASARLDMENEGAMTPELSDAFDKYEEHLALGDVTTPASREYLSSLADIINPALAAANQADLDEYFQEAEDYGDASDMPQPRYERYTLPGGRNYREVLLTLPISSTARTAQQDRYNQLVAAGVPLLEAREIATETNDELQDRIFAIQKESEPLLTKVEDFARLIASYIEGYSPITVTNWLLEHPAQEEWQPQIEQWMSVMGEDAKQWIANRGYMNNLARWQNLNLKIQTLRVVKRMRDYEARGYESKHWSERNVLVHVRMNDRVDADGKRVLFVEEVQSDWGQAGVKYGFANQRAADEAELAELLAQQEATPTESRRKQIARVQGRLRRGQYEISRAPYVETTDGWLNLGLKQIMLEAVRGNYDRVAFVTGDQSKERYKLSKQISRVVYKDNFSGGIAPATMQGPPSAGRLFAYDLNGQLVIEEAIEDYADIENYIGKEVADKLLQSEPKRGDFGGIQSRDRELSGLDLDVGGEGMVEFYDKIVPIAMGKLLKKYGGGKVGTIEIDTRTPESEAYYAEPTDADILPQPGFAITPELVKKLESGLPLFQAMPQRGPVRGWFDPARMAIRLTQSQDWSTFWHELNHYFLHTYVRIANEGNAPQVIKNDLDTLFQWFKIDGATFNERLAAWNALSFEQQREHYEALAYNSEIYVVEGKAPSLELRAVFARLSAFIRRVYRSIRDDLNAIYRREFGKDLPVLTPEIRQVMDRMLASEEQIKRYQAVQSMAPYFQSQEQAGMDDATWAAYVEMGREAEEAAVTDLTKASLQQMRWLSNARSRIFASMQREEEKRRKEVRKEVTDELRTSRTYRAMDYLRTGTYRDADGVEVSPEGPHHLSIKRIKAIYEGMPSEESLRAVLAAGGPRPANVQPNWPALGTGKGGMLREDGLDPDIVATTFGYSSGDEMIRDLVAAKPLKEAVASRTDEVMLARYGEQDTPEAREARVQAALHNEARARFVAVELRHLARATEPVRVMLEAARIAAEDMIGRKRIRDIRPSEYEAAEARAARDATNAYRLGGNPAAAAQAAYTRAKNAVMAAPRANTPEALLAASEAAEAAGQVARAAAMEASAGKIKEFTDQYGNVDPETVILRAKRTQLYQNQLAAEAGRAKEYVDKQVKYLRKVLSDENVKRMGADAADQVRMLLERFNLAPMSLKRMDERKSLEQWIASMRESGIEPDIAPWMLAEANRIPYREMPFAQFKELVDAVRQIEYVGKNEQKVLLEKKKAEFSQKAEQIVANIRDVAKDKNRVEKARREATTNLGEKAAKLRGFFASHLKAWAIVETLDGGKGGPLWDYLIRTANERGDMETEMTAEATRKLAEIMAPWYAGGRMRGAMRKFPSIDRSLSRESRLAVALNMGNAGNIQRLLDGEGWTLEQIQPVLESLTAAEWDAVQQIWDFMDSYRPLIAAKERRLYGKEPKWVEPQPLTVRTSDGQVKTLRGGYYPIVYDKVASLRAETQSELQESEAQIKAAYTSATTRRTFTKARAAKVEDRPLLLTMQGLWTGVTDVIHDLSWHEWLIDANRLMRSREFDAAVRAIYGPEAKLELKRWIDDNAAGVRGQMLASNDVSSFLRQNISMAGLGYSIRGALLQVTGFANSIVRVGYKPLLNGIATMALNPRATMRRINAMSTFMENRSRTQFRELDELRNRVKGERGFQRVMRLHAYTMMLSMQRLVDIPTWLAGYENAIAAGKDEATAIAMADQDVISSQGSGMLKDLSRIERERGLTKLFTLFYSFFNTVLNMTVATTMTTRSKAKLAHDMLLLLVVPVMAEQAIRGLLTPDIGDEEDDPEKIAARLSKAQIEYLLGQVVYVRELNYMTGLLTDGMRGYEGPAGLRALSLPGRFGQQALQGDMDRAFIRSTIDLIGVGTGLPTAQINRTIDGVDALMEGETENPLSVITGVDRR